MAQKRRPEHSDQIKKIKLYMIFGYALIIIIAAFIMSSQTIHKNDEILKTKVSELTYALNEQMKLNINTYLSKLESIGTLVFGTDEIRTYDATAENEDQYEALSTEKKISDKLYDLCIMENYVDFFIVYSNNHTVGKVSNGTINLYKENIYESMSESLTRVRSNDGWSTGYNDDFRRIYYAKRIHENAVLVASFYTMELQNVFVRPDDMKDTTVRMVDKDYSVIYSSSSEESGYLLDHQIQSRIGSLSSASVMDDDYLITVTSCADDWFVICTVPTRIVLAERDDVVSFTIIIAAVASLIAIALGTGLSIYVTNPVNHIVSVLNSQAQLDRLTGILNKLSFEENTEYTLSNASDSEHHAVILIDLDNFKGVNDILGHSYGDKVLADVGNILRITFKSTDCLGRIGGDEFCVTLNIPENSQQNYMELISEKCRDLCDAFHNNYTGDNNDYKISASIGVAVFPENGRSFPELYKAADKALYSSKKKGKDTFTFYCDMSEEERNDKED